jgi:elongation factor P hydroxylase
MVRGGKGKAKSSKTTLCAAGEKGCVKPDGTVTWVFCEACTQWYHCPCANIDGKKANDEDFIFHCKSCKPAKEKVRPDSRVLTQQTTHSGVLFYVGI